VRRFFEALAQEQPLVLVSEDLHCVLDEIEQGRLCPRASETVLRLAPLSEEETVELVTSAGPALAGEVLVLRRERHVSATCQRLPTELQGGAARSDALEIRTALNPQ